MASLTIQVTVDEDGNCRLECEDADGDMVDAFDDLEPDQATRTVRLTLEISPAKVQELRATIPDAPSGEMTIRVE